MTKKSSRCAACMFLMLFAGGLSRAAELQQRTLTEYDHYLSGVEANFDARLKGDHFLWTEESAERLAKVRGGEVVAQNWKGDAPISIFEGDINDFIGAVFIPGKTIEQVLAIVRDYDNYKKIYQPEVVESRMLSQDGNHYKVFLKYVKKFILTVGYNTEHDIRYIKMDEKHWQNRSRTTKVTELENPGTPDEKALPGGTGNGFLWRLYSACGFEQVDGGVIMECRAVTLSAPLPAALRWASSTVQEIPKQSLVSTLELTRDALK